MGSLAARGVGIAAQVLLLMLSARSSSSEAVGAFSLYATWLLFAAAVIDLGAAQYLLRESSVVLKSGGDPTAALLGTMALTGLAWLVLMAAAVAAVRMPFAVPARYAGIALFAAGSALPATWLSVLGQALRSYARPSQSMLLLFAAAPLASIVIIGVCLQQGVRLVWQVLAAANLAGLCIAMLTALCLCLHARPGAKAGVAPGPRVRMPRLADLTGQYYASLLTVAFVALPSFVLPVLVSVGEIGLFYVALRITTLLASVLDAVAGIYAPRVAACFSVGDLAGVREEFRRSLRITRLSGVVLGMVLLGLAPQLLALFGEQYRDAAELLRLQMLGRVVQLFTGITSNVLWMIGQPLLEGSLSIAAAGLTIFCAGLSFATPAVVVSVAVSLGHAFKNGAQFFLLQRIFRRLPRARQQ